MPQLDDFISKAQIQAILDADKALKDLDETHRKMIDSAKATSTIINTNVASYTQLKTVQEQTTAQTTKLGEAERQAAKIEKEEAATLAALDKQRQAALSKMTELSLAHKNSVLAIANENKELNKQRVLLDTNSKEYADLSKKIAANTEKLKHHDKEIGRDYLNVGNYGSALKGVGTKLLGLGAALGVTVGAMQIFKSIMSSTEQIADKFAEFLQGSKQGFEFLARSIANLDFTNLIQGFRDAFREGERYAQVLDEIEDRERSLGIRKLDIEGQITDQKIIARSIKSTTEEKRAAIDEIIRLEQLKLDETKKITELGLQNELQNAAQITGVNEELILGLVSNYDAYAGKIEEAKKLQADLNSLITESTIIIGDQVTKVQDTEAYDKALKNLTPTERELLDILKASNILTGEKRDLIAKAVSADIQAVNEQKDGVLTLSKLQNSLEREYLSDKKEAVSAATKSEDEKVKAAEDAKERRIKIMDDEIAYEADLYDKEIQAKVDAEKAKTKAVEEANEANRKLKEEQIETIERISHPFTDCH